MKPGQEFKIDMGTAQDGPTMPADVRLTASVNWHGHDLTKCKYQFSFSLEYEDKPAGYQDPPPVTSGWLDKPEWTVGPTEWGSGIYGGHAKKVTLSVHDPIKNATCTHDLDCDFWILGGPIYRLRLDDQTKQPKLFQYLKTLGMSNLHFEILKAIARKESETTQFSDQQTSSTRHKRYPLRSADNGYGMYQLTIPAPNRDQIWNWKENTAEAYRRVLGFDAKARQYLGSHTFTEDQVKLEIYSRYRKGDLNPYHVWDSGQNKWVPNPDNPTGVNYANDAVKREYSTP